MIFSVYCPLLAPLLAMPVVRWVAGRLSPLLASWLVLVASALLAGCAALALGLLVVAALSVVGSFARLGHWSPNAIWRLDAVHLPIDITASVLLLAFAALAVATAVRRLRALAEAHRTARDCQSDSELLVLRDERPIAHALPGRPGRIVVSTAMLSALAPAERRALLAHERAHLAARHHLFVAAVDVFAAANPVLRPLTATIRFTTERWADEAAARHIGDRAVAARAVGKAALAGRDLLRPRIALAATTGPVPRRVAALLTAPAHRPHPFTMACIAVAFGLVTGSVFFVLDAAIDLHRVLEIAQTTLVR